MFDLGTDSSLDEFGWVWEGRNQSFLLAPHTLLEGLRLEIYRCSLHIVDTLDKRICPHLDLD